jgi:hypothetical protein
VFGITLTVAQEERRVVQKVRLTVLLHVLSLLFLSPSPHRGAFDISFSFFSFQYQRRLSYEMQF